MLIGVNIKEMNSLGVGKVKVGNASAKQQLQQLILKLNNGNIVLTADLDKEYHRYKNFKLKIGNSEKTFNWSSIGNPSFLPAIEIIDLGNNKNAGVAIFLVQSEGTGTFIQDVHVFRIDDFKEIPVEDPLKIIQKHIKTQRMDDGIMINVDGNNILLDKKYLEKYGVTNNADKLVYDNHIMYVVKNNNLYGVVGVSNEDLNYVGNIIIEYTFGDGMYIMNKINYEKYK